MANDKVLERLLSITNNKLQPSCFNPLINQSTADNVANSLCTILSITSNIEGSILKANLRKSAIELALELCKNTNVNNEVNQMKESRSDIISRHCMDTENTPDSKQLRRQKLYEELDFTGVQNLRFLSYNRTAVKPMDTNFELAAAMINCTTEKTILYLNSLVSKCLKNNSDFNEPTFEFLKNIWESEKLIISSQTFDLLSEHLISLLETNFLNVALKLLEGNCVSESTIDNLKVNTALHSQFPNYKNIIERAAYSSHLFQIIFSILSDIFQRSHHDDTIQCLITYILDEIKCHRASVVDLYPMKIKNIVHFLESNPENISSLPFLYKHILDLIDELFMYEDIHFVLLMSHYNVWFKKFFELKIFLNVDDL